MTDLVESLPRAAAGSRPSVLRLALLGLAGAGLLTALGLLFQTAPASADEAPPPQGSLLGSVVHGTVGALLPGDVSPQTSGSASSSGGLVGSVLAPVTGAVDPVVTSLPVVGGVVDTLLGPTPTGSVVGAVDGVLGGVTGTGGTTSPSAPPPPVEPGPPAATPAPAAGSAGSPAAAPAPPAATTPTDSDAEPAAASALPAATPAPSSAAASTVATPGDAPVHGPAFGPAASSEGVLTSGGSGGPGSAAEPVDSWMPPPAVHDTSCAARSTRPSSAPPGDHDVSPG